MLQAFKNHLDGVFPNLRNRSLLIACSGGVDSIVLVHLCEALDLNYASADCNFGLRGAESEADENLVATLSKSLDRAYFVTHFDTLGYVRKKGISVQMAARELRYRWFYKILEQKQIECLLTAHHADDALETFLINLSRGTGLEGLTGIPSDTGSIIRPLLPFTRAQILDYARAEKLKWREDSSNEDIKYLRNKIRLELIPILKELHPTFMENFLSTQSYLSGSSEILHQYARELREKWFEEGADYYRIPIEPLVRLRPQQDYLHLLLGPYGFREGKDIADLLSANSGKGLYSKSHRLIKDREHLLLQKLYDPETISYEIPLAEGKFTEPIVLYLEEVQTMSEQSPHILYVDKETLNPMLTLRKWRKGDYFYPLGMKGKKKVSKYFKDEKMDLIAKESQWLLCSGDAIVWVLGRRADERFKITRATRAIMKISWIS